jgi:hypothetical protein
VQQLCGINLFYAHIQCYFSKENRFWNAYSDPTFGQGGVEITYIAVRKKWFIPACALLIENYRNSVPACSVTKIPLPTFS